MSTREKILAWVSIIVGGGVILGIIGAGVGLYVNHAVAQSFVNAKPSSVAAVELDIQLMQKGLEHIVLDVAENKRIAQDTNTILREYLEDQAK